MSTISPPQPRVATISTRAFPVPLPYVRQQAVLDYFGDLCASYGTTLSESHYAAGGHHDFTSMCAELVRSMGIGELDLVVLAHALPDYDPRRSAACYLVDTLPNEPLAFAVSDQGTAAPFSALNLAAASNPVRALVIVVDQATLPYPGPDGLIDQAVGIVLEPNGGLGLDAIIQHPDVRPRHIHEVLRAELSEVSGPVYLLLGTGLRSADLTSCGEVTVRRVATAGICTPLWAELGDVMSLARSFRHVVAADYDSALGYLCLARMSAS